MDTKFTWQLKVIHYGNYHLHCIKGKQSQSVSEPCSQHQLMMTQWSNPLKSNKGIQIKKGRTKMIFIRGNSVSWKPTNFMKQVIDYWTRDSPIHRLTRRVKKERCTQVGRDTRGIFQRAIPSPLPLALWLLWWSTLEWVRFPQQTSPRK